VGDPLSLPKTRSPRWESTTKGRSAIILHRKPPLATGDHRMVAILIGLLTGVLGSSVAAERMMLGSQIATPLSSQTTNGDARCKPSESVYRPRRLREGDWEQTIQVDVCVPDDDALRIVLAIRDRQLVNRQHITFDDESLRRPTLPSVDLSQVIGIQAAGRPGGKSRQYFITLVETPGRLEHLRLLVNALSEQVEVVSSERVRLSVRPHGGA
jgi:hypothetical protein